MHVDNFAQVEMLLVRRRVMMKEISLATKQSYSFPDETRPIRTQAEQMIDLHVRPDKFSEFLKEELIYVDRQLKILGVDTSES